MRRGGSPPRNFRLLGALATLALSASIGACGPQHVPVQVVYETPQAIQPPTIHLDLSGVDALEDPETREAATLRMLGDAGFQPLTTARIAGTFVVRAEREQPHAELVVMERQPAWTPGAVQALIQSMYLVPGDETPEDFLFVGPTPPFALQYVFSTAWWSLLEARLYAGFSTPELPLDQVDPYLEHAISVIEEFGGAREDIVATLSTLMDALPRPEDRSGYRPAATLLAVGLLLGEEVRRHQPQLTWMPGAEAQARYFALGMDGQVQLRPIDFAFLLYSDELPGGVEGYLELVEVRLGE